MRKSSNSNLMLVLNNSPLLNGIIINNPKFIKLRFKPIKEITKEM
jgi:hypothetical protein